MPREALLRWFVGPDSEPWPDWSGRAKGVGRSAYTGFDAASVRAAAGKNAFARAFSGRARRVAADVLVARAGSAGLAAWTQRLGLARRAGRVAVGQASVQEAMRTSVGLVVLALDAGAAAEQKFAANARRKGVPIARASGALLGGALGREFVSVASISGATFVVPLTRWAEALATYPDSGVEFEGAGGALGTRGQHGANGV